MCLGEVLDCPIGNPEGSTPNMDTDRQTQVAGELPVPSGDIHGGELRSAQCHRHQLLSRRKILGANAPCIIRMIQLTFIGPLWSGLRNTITKDGSQPTLLESANHSIGMFRSVLNMRPVKEGRDACIERLKCSNKCPNIGVFGSEDRTKLRENMARVVTKIAIGSKLFESSFPGMTMGINKSWHHNHP